MAEGQVLRFQHDQNNNNNNDFRSTSGEIYLLIIGKTGTGKSALGNSILKRKAFESNPSMTSVTKTVQCEVSGFKDRVIKVVDGPSLDDTRMDKKATNMFMDAISNAFLANRQGNHAFLLVVKFGGRLTAEVQDTIAFLKKKFGANFLRDFCILVMTCGDYFEFESKETRISFQDWCSEQKGFFNELFMECNKRVLLFDNKTNDEAKIVGQIHDLIQMVDKLSILGNRYSAVDFEKAKQT